MNIHAIADEILWMLHHSMPGASAPAALQSWQQESNVKLSPVTTAQVLAFIANKNVLAQSPSTAAHRTRQIWEPAHWHLFLSAVPTDD
jgi:hypothetical protein